MHFDQAGVDILNKLFSLGVPTSVMKLVGGKLCSLALDERVCTGMIDHFLVSNFKLMFYAMILDFRASPISS